MVLLVTLMISSHISYALPGDVWCFARKAIAGLESYTLQFDNKKVSLELKNFDEGGFVLDCQKNVKTESNYTCTGRNTVDVFYRPVATEELGETTPAICVVGDIEE